MLQYSPDVSPNLSYLLREVLRVWEITTTVAAAENGEELVTYGIRLNATVINDLSPDRHETEEFVRLLNRLGASEIHAYELAEDFLGKVYGG